MITPAEYFEIMKGRFDAEKLTELYHTNEFTLAVAVALSAQATDKHVNTVTPALFSVADTPEKMLDLGLEGLKEYIKSVSFFNNKAKNIIGMAEKLVAAVPRSHDLGPAVKPRDDKDWKFPEKYHDRDMLETLPGIGRKTANVVSSILWGAPNIGVDTHVFRLAHRLNWADDADNTPEKVERKLLAVIPKNLHGVANHLMVMHGRYICKALRPDCANCPVRKLCVAKDNFTV